MAMLAENGPCKILPDVTTEVNPYSWTTKANVIWLDQPTSVGFSHGGQRDQDYNETNVGENIYWFLQGFLEKHPELVDREFFVTGESYGGHYVPVAAHYIWEKNCENSSDGIVKINLQGIAIGNGLTNPAIQYLYNADMANNAYNISLLTPSQVRQMRIDAVECVALTSECQQYSVNCAKAQGCWQEKLIRPFAGSERNRYDIRRWCHPDFPLCYDFSNIHVYLDSDHVREMLHVDPGLGPWLEINNNVMQTFVTDGDWSMSYHTYVADLLNDNLRAVIYAGDADLVCNWIGNQAWTLSLDWKGKDGFNAAEERIFTHPLLSNRSSSVDAGVVRSFENFAFVRVYDAGHMVPMDQPAVALALLNKFLANEDL
ncbi:hypothetical protein BBJ29_006476 [Phytophthora kernoviae]|uniref:Carboxypeptidase n=1 Tax=Phytophthora kernoviae TaxID=325452 RepID=A0A3R7H7I7_9STRA|nr:hypothetical protein BBJ29_006476 [Phytophthora kernoviae]